MRVKFAICCCCYPDTETIDLDCLRIFVAFSRGSSQLIWQFDKPNEIKRSKYLLPSLLLPFFPHYPIFRDNTKNEVIVVLLLSLCDPDVSN